MQPPHHPQRGTKWEHGDPADSITSEHCGYRAWAHRGFPVDWQDWGGFVEHRTKQVGLFLSSAFHSTFYSSNHTAAAIFKVSSFLQPCCDDKGFIYFVGCKCKMLIWYSTTVSFPRTLWHQKIPDKPPATCSSFSCRNTEHISKHAHTFDGVTLNTRPLCVPCYTAKWRATASGPHSPARRDRPRARARANCVTPAPPAHPSPTRSWLHAHTSSQGPSITHR